MSAANDMPQDNRSTNRETARVWNTDLILVCTFAVVCIAIIVGLASNLRGQPACTCCSWVDPDDPGLNWKTKKLTLLEQRIEELERDLQATKLSFKDTDNRRSVFVEVKLPTKQTLAAGDTIIFTHPLVNVGNSYHTDFGFFQPPVNGTYSISATVCTGINTWIVFGLIRDHDVIDEIIVGDLSWHHCATSAVVIYVTSENKVWVKVLRTKNGVIEQNYGISSFTGVLINTLSP